MDDKTAALIQHLADKLGTTGAHLWGVLVRQAPISGATNLLAIVLWSVAAAWIFKMVKKKTSAKESRDAEWTDEGAGLAWLLWGVFTFVGTVIAVCNLETIVGALVNPEYWALSQVLSQIK